MHVGQLRRQLSLFYNLWSAKRQLLAVTAVVLILSYPVAGVDKISVEYDRETDYLPYHVTVQHQFSLPDSRIPLPMPAQTLESTINGKTQRIAVVGLNAGTRDTTAGHIITFNVETWQPKDDHPTDLTLSDFTIIFDSAAQKLAVFTTGYRQDTAFFYKIYPGSRTYQHLALVGNCDRSKSEWAGIREVVLTADIDADNRTELLLLVGSAKNLKQKHLVCVDPETMTIKWSRPFPYYVIYASTGMDGDNSPRAVHLIGHGVHDSIDTPTSRDLYCHLITLNSTGEILYDQIIARPNLIPMYEINPDNGLIYVSHTVAFSESMAIADTAAEVHRLSAIDGEHQVVHWIDISEDLSGIWMQDYKRDGTLDVYTVSDLGVIRVYSSDLTLLAESGPNPPLGSYGGRLAPLDGEDSVLTFISVDGLGLYNLEFHKLALIPSSASIPLTLGATDGKLTAVLASDFQQYTVALLHERSFSEYLTIFWLDYQYYIAMAVTFLAVSFLLVFGYGRRVRSQKIQLETAHQQLHSAHHELKEAHHALRLAQEQIIAKEKQKVMQNLSASFAHEIRNALFPAQMSVYRMTEGPDKIPVEKERFDKLLAMTATSVSRAIALTELISQYTKLESQYLAESTRFAEVVHELLTVNAARFESGKIAVQYHGPEDARVAMHHQHLHMVLSNLLLNALDAVAGQPSPNINLHWVAKGKCLEVIIADNGHGVPESDRPHIFEPFFTTKPNSGTGLGLAITRKLIDMYGGTISVAGQPGGGAAFTLSLKLWQTESGASIRT